MSDPLPATHPPTASPRQGDDALAALEELMGHLEEGAILPPLVVVQALAANPNLKVRARPRPRPAGRGLLVAACRQAAGTIRRSAPGRRSVCGRAAIPGPRMSKNHAVLSILLPMLPATAGVIVTPPPPKKNPTHLASCRPLAPQVSLVKGFVGRALARDTADIERDRCAQRMGHLPLPQLGAGATKRLRHAPSKGHAALTCGPQLGWRRSGSIRTV
jgi:hypothetical protein